MIDTDTIRIIVAQPWFAVIAGSLFTAVVVIALVLAWEAIHRFVGRRW